VRNVESGKITVFPCGAWLSKVMGDQQLSRELSASIGGRSVMKKTTYTVNVKTSNLRSAGTGANVSCILFGERGREECFSELFSICFQSPTVLFSSFMLYVSTLRWLP